MPMMKPRWRKKPAVQILDWFSDVEAGVWEEEEAGKKEGV